MQTVDPKEFFVDYTQSCGEFNSVKLWEDFQKTLLFDLMLGRARQGEFTIDFVTNEINMIDFTRDLEKELREWSYYLSSNGIEVVNDQRTNKVHIDWSENYDID